MNLVSQIKNIDNPQTFNELCDVLFNSIWGLDYEPIADDQSDRGNDGYRKSTKTLFAKHCFRKRQKSGLNSEIIKKAKEDLKKAAKLAEGGFEIAEWTFVTPYFIPE